jgi:hypothetical protein
MVRSAGTAAAPAPRRRAPAAEERTGLPPENGMEPFSLPSIRFQRAVTALIAHQLPKYHLMPVTNV